MPFFERMRFRAVPFRGSTIGFRQPSPAFGSSAWAIPVTATMKWSGRFFACATTGASIEPREDAQPASATSAEAAAKRPVTLTRDVLRMGEH